MNYIFYSATFIYVYIFYRYIHIYISICIIFIYYIFHYLLRFIQIDDSTQLNPVRRLYSIVFDSTIRGRRRIGALVKRQSERAPQRRGTQLLVTF